jgi:hypothetical protein
MLNIHGNFVWNTLSQAQIYHSELDHTIDDDSTNSEEITTTGTCGNLILV